MLFMLLHEYYISCESCSEGGAVLMEFHTFNLGPKIPYITQTVQCRDTFMNREILKMFFKKFTGNNTGLNVAMIWECIIFLKKLCNKSQH